MQKHLAWGWAVEALGALPAVAAVPPPARAAPGGPALPCPSGGQSQESRVPRAGPAAHTPRRAGLGQAAGLAGSSGLE